MDSLFLQRGEYTDALDEGSKWVFKPIAKKGDRFFVVDNGSRDGSTDYLDADFGFVDPIPTNTHSIGDTIFRDWGGDGSQGEEEPRELSKTPIQVCRSQELSLEPNQEIVRPQNWFS